MDQSPVAHQNAVSAEDETMIQEILQEHDQGEMEKTSGPTECLPFIESLGSRREAFDRFPPESDAEADKEGDVANVIDDHIRDGICGLQGEISKQADQLNLVRQACATFEQSISYMLEQQKSMNDILSGLSKTSFLTRRSSSAHKDALQQEFPIPSSSLKIARQEAPSQSMISGRTCSNNDSEKMRASEPSHLSVRSPENPDATSPSSENQILSNSETSTTPVSETSQCHMHVKPPELPNAKEPRGDQAVLSVLLHERMQQQKSIEPNSCTASDDPKDKESANKESFNEKSSKKQEKNTLLPNVLTPSHACSQSQSTSNGIDDSRESFPTNIDDSTDEESSDKESFNENSSWTEDQKGITPNAVTESGSYRPRKNSIAIFSAGPELGQRILSKSSTLGEGDLKKIKRLTTQDYACSSRLSHSQEFTGQSLWSRVQSGIRNPAFDMTVAVVILLNTVLMAFQTDWVAQNLREPGADDGGWMTQLGLAFTIFFSLDLLMRLVIEKKIFFTGPSKHWNIFDLFVVGSAIAEEVLSILVQQGPGVLANAKVMRILRILRLMRVLRVMRAGRFFRELRAIVYGIILSFRSLLWACILGASTIFLFAVFTTQGVSFYFIGELENGHDPSISQETRDLLQQHCGTLSSTMFSLWKAVSGGMDWGDVADPLFTISPMMGLIFLLYTIFMICAIMNMITGVFVNKALKLAESDMDIMLLENDQVRQEFTRKIDSVFKSADSDGNGTIDSDEFAEHFQDPVVQAFFRYLDIDIEATDPEVLFKMLDFDQSGSLDSEEFCRGCLVLKGYARSMDLARYMWQHGKKTKELMNVTQELKLKQEQQIQEIQDLVKGLLQSNYTPVHLNGNLPTATQGTC